MTEELIGRKRPCINSRRRKKITSFLLERDGNVCHYCKEIMTPNGLERIGTTMTREHVVPLCYGGGSTQDNMVLACNDCNNRRGDVLFFCECIFCDNAYSLYYFKE